MLRILTAGESHGKGLIGIIEGFPSNVPINLDLINHDLERRQMGYGRGNRMKIEKDRIEIISGIRGGQTLGSPISFIIYNKDYENWTEYMHPFEVNKEDKQVVCPRPGHADLSGMIKYNFYDIRNVIERSSARETAVRVAAGSIIKQLLEIFNIKIYSHVISIGNITNKEKLHPVTAIEKADLSPVRCVEKATEKKMLNIIDTARVQGDSLGGIFELQITGVPVGLGSYVHWDRKLDAKLAYSLMSVQGIKGVEIGEAFNNAIAEGSVVHDEILYSKEKGYYRKTNNAGGIEGGMSNGEYIIIRCAMKPIPTLYKPLESINVHTKEKVLASVERSDTCAVPAASIVGEMCSISVIAEEFLRKYGGDSLEEIMKRWKG